MNKVQELAKKKWQSIYTRNPSDKLTWDFYLSDPFPQKWPQDEKGTFVVYAVAKAVDIKNITSGEIKGPIWARAIISDLKSEPRLEVLTTEMKPGAKQAMRPLTQDELNILSVKPLELFQKKMTLESEKSLKNYFRLQQSLGNIPDGIEASHADFFSWLKKP